MAYLAQSPWIRSGTVRDVVVQELPFDEKQYWHPVPDYDSDVDNAVFIGFAVSGHSYVVNPPKPSAELS